MSTTRPSGHDEYDSVGDRDQEEPSTLILETSTVANLRKTEETTGDDEETEVKADEGARTGIRCRETDKRGQTESGATTTTKEEEADTKVGSTVGEARNTKHAVRPVEGQETSMHPEEQRRVTEDSGRVGPLRGEYEEEDDNDESWHDTREDGWETVACGKAKNGAATAPKGEAKGRAEDREVENPHV